MDDLAVPRQQRAFDGLVVPIDVQYLVLLVEHRVDEGQEVLGIERGGVDRDGARQIERSGNAHAAVVDDLAGFGQLAVATALCGEIDDHGAGPHALHHRPGDEFWRGAARDQRCRDDDVLRLDVVGDQFGLLGLILGRHRLGIAGRGLSLFELVVLDRDELRAERGDLFLGRGTDVGRGHDRAEATCGRDRLQPGDADAHDEDLACRHGAGSGHHHRYRLLEHRGGIDNGLVAGEVRLAR